MVPADALIWLGRFSTDADIVKALSERLAGSTDSMCHFQDCVAAISRGEPEGPGDVHIELYRMGPPYSVLVSRAMQNAAQHMLALPAQQVPHWGLVHWLNVVGYGRIDDIEAMADMANLALRQILECQSDKDRAELELAANSAFNGRNLTFDWQAAMGLALSAWDSRRNSG